MVIKFSFVYLDHSNLNRNPIYRFFCMKKIIRNSCFNVLEINKLVSFKPDIAVDFIWITRIHGHKKSDLYTGIHFSLLGQQLTVNAPKGKIPYQVRLIM